jgi:hypothetical protein
MILPLNPIFYPFVGFYVLYDSAPHKIVELTI